MTQTEKIESLEKAESMVIEAADIIEECIRMTDLDKRFGDLPEQLRSLASSNDGDSIRNLIRETEYADEEHPVWTRPLVSVKNTDRKDI